MNRIAKIIKQFDSPNSQPGDFSSPDGQRKKLWAIWSYRTANLLLTMGYYFGAIPVFWNRKGVKMGMITSRFDKIRWICTIFLAAVIQVAILVVYFIDLYFYEDPVKFISKHTIRGAYCIASGFAMLFHFHTAWKYKEFVSFINDGAQFYESFQNKYATDAEWNGTTFEDALSGIVKFFFFVGTASLSLLTTAGYLFKCEVHFLAPLLPICEQNYSIIWSLLLTACLMFAQIWFCQVLAASIILYIDLFAAVVLVGHYMACEMVDYTKKKRRTTRLLLAQEHWHRNYNCLHLIVLQLNGCIGEVFMPVHMLLISLLTAFTIFGLVMYTAKLGIMFGLFCFMILVLLGVYYVFLIGRGSSFSDEMDSALIMRRNTLNTKYLKTLHKSCMPVRPAVGIFFPLKGHTVGTMLSTSLEIAVDLMLAID